MPSLTAVACVGSAFGAVLGTRRISFGVLGFVARQSNTLLAASPSRFLGCTEGFYRTAREAAIVAATLRAAGMQQNGHRPERTGGDADGGAAALRLPFQEPVRWRVRGAGTVSMHPFSL